MEHVFTSGYLPLDQTSVWLRGNHHGHSTRSDGEDDPFEIVSAYEASGYAYLALSEHDLFVDPQVYQPNTAMTILPAVEITSIANQTLMYLGAGPEIPAANALSLPQISDFVLARGGLFIVDHPNWLYQSPKRHATLEELLVVPNLAAIEIYTGVIERLPGNPHALEVWDGLLTAGRKVFGHAVDDQHNKVDRFLGWNCVQWPAGVPIRSDGIIDALFKGSFYASTGVTIRRLGVSEDGQSIVIESDAEEIRWRVRDGMLADVTEGGDGRLPIGNLPNLDRLNSSWRRMDTPGDAIYVRAELAGPKGRYAWTQPFFIATR